MSGCYGQFHYPELDWLSGNKKHDHPWKLFITNSHNNRKVSSFSFTVSSYHRPPRQITVLHSFISSLSSTVPSYRHSPPQITVLHSFISSHSSTGSSHHHSPSQFHHMITPIHSFITSSLYSIVTSYHHSPPHIIK